MKNVDGVTTQAVRPAAGFGDQSSTRQRLLSLLLRRGPQTTSELSDALGLATAGIRRHLNGLEADGLIEASEPDQSGRGRGRPARTYTLSAAGRGCFGQDYDELAISAIGELIAAAGPQVLNRLAETQLSAVSADYQARRKSDPSLDPSRALAQSLSAAGYFASQTSGERGADVYQHHCPVAHVAAQYPQLCQAETQVLARLLGVDVERRTTIAHGAARCQLHVVEASGIKAPDDENWAGENRNVENRKVRQ